MMKMRKYCALVGALSLVGMGGSCMADSAGQGNTVQFETLAKGNYSGVDQQRFQTIRDQQTWQRIWRQTFARKSPMPKLPKVDFSQYIVMALFLGQKRTGGYGLQVRRIDSHPKSMVVHISLISPGKGCASTQALTQPYQIIELPATSKEILFQTTPRRNSC
jgi:hypothetical protein